MKTPVLELQSITKKFPGVLAVDNLDFNLAPGTIHSLIGANGSGKSTTVKIIAGVHQQDSGKCFLKGKEIKLNFPQDAKDNGIITVFQERQIFPDLTVAENIFLDRMKLKNNCTIDWEKSVEEAQQLLSSFGLDFDCSKPMYKYGVGIQQMVEIIRGMVLNPDILILDEPTASLSRSEVESLFSFMKDLKLKNVALLFIAHNLDEVIEISDEVTVMRDGVNAGHIDDLSTVNKATLIQMMLGEDVNIDLCNENSIKICDAKYVEAKKIKLDTWDTEVSFHIRRGEVLAITGLLGSGASEIAKKIAGVLPTGRSEILFEGKSIVMKSTADAMKKGIAYLPPDRKKYGLFMNLNNRDNITGSILNRISKKKIYKKQAALDITQRMIIETNIVPANPDFQTVQLSGGNQQKVLFSRIIATEPDLIVLESPTVGVDVKAQFEIHKLIREKAANGLSILLVSNDYHEVSVVADRVLIIREGQLKKELKSPPFYESTLLHLVGVENTGENGRNE